QKLLPVFVLTTVAVIIVILVVTTMVDRNLRFSILQFVEIAKEVADGKQTLTAEPETVDEISDALHQVLLLLRAKSTFKNIDNPYVAGNPIRTMEMFFGRKEDLGWIMHQLSAQTNLMLGLFGARRIGKTSLLHHIHASSSQPTAKLFTVFIDTQEMLPDIVGDASFYRFLGTKITQSTNDRSLNGQTGSAGDLS